MEKENFTPWTEKYRPQKLSEIVGHGKAIGELQIWTENFKKEKQKALLLHGPTGNGKTAAVYALANDLDYEVLELNASDMRTRETIEQTIGHAVKQASLLDKKGKIILIDEIDGIYGTVDRGGLPAIYKIISETRFPVILTANDPWKTKLKNLRHKCKIIQFRKVNVRSQVKRLKQICEEEKIKAGEDLLHKIAELSEGDLRAAINDLQAIGGGKNSIIEKDLEQIYNRNKGVQIFETLLAIFKSKDKNRILEKFWNSDKSPDEVMQWLVENIAKEYEKPEEVAKAYDMLSRADVFKGRIIHNQAWTLNSFANEIMALGVASAKAEKYHKFTKYAPPGILLKMGRTKARRALRDQLAGKIGEVCHCSRKRAIEQFPYLAIIEEKKGLSLSMEEEELEFLKSFT